MPGDRPRVLVVDDDQDICLVLQRVLGRAGLDTVTASDGQHGLDLLREQHPDVVVLDLGLPDMDGGEVLDQIHAHSDAVVLVVTARTLDTAGRAALVGRGAADFLAKPFGNDELMARTLALLHRRGVHRAPGGRARGGGEERA